jgi:hypothetical protein
VKLVHLVGFIIKKYKEGKLPLFGTWEGVLGSESASEEYHEKK